MSATPELGVCYYPEHWPEANWTDDAERMRALGIRYVRIGEFAWSRIEPGPGRYDWPWLERAIATLAAQNLRIILGTPTACPPKWLIDANPGVLAVDARGRRRTFGSRRHYCFSSPVYRRECRRIVAELAARFAAHPAVHAWQIDNEYGCHDTVLSYSASACDAFRRWLAVRYDSIDALNAAWGNVFWSMEYGSFGEVDLPNGTVTEANPAHWLDFRRFSSDQVAAFNREQVAVLREAGVAADLVHNYMGASTDFDHFDVGRDLDVASWDSYPLGFLEHAERDPARKARYRRQGDPDFAGFHHDLYRAVGRGRWWVMEQQPGPVNWAAANAAPLPGMVRLWALEAFAHGAEMVSFFRWRQARFGQEQNHAGLLLPDSTTAPAYAEVEQLAADLATLVWQSPRQAPVALVTSYDAHWITTIQPQAGTYALPAETLAWYRAVRRLGVDIDVCKPGADLDGYRAVIVPGLPAVDQALVTSLQDSGATLLLGPRTGSKTRDFQVPTSLPPGLLQELIALRVTQVDSLTAGLRLPVMNDVEGEYIHTWLEHIDTILEPRERSADGVGIWFQHERTYYLAACLSTALLDRIVQSVLEEAGVPTFDLPPGVRLRRRGDTCFAFNYSPESRPTPGPGACRLLGTDTLEPGGVAAWRIQE